MGAAGESNDDGPAHEEGDIDVSQSLGLLELLGRRWTPQIIHELSSGALGFRELRRRCSSMSSSVLSQRLSELSGANVVAPDDFGSWELTERGEIVASHLVAMMSELSR
jgi:DNA-binding HxlR family transcriptional regulator